jgi:hypothetical protein
MDRVVTEKIAEGIWGSEVVDGDKIEAVAPCGVVW